MLVQVFITTFALTDAEKRGRNKEHPITVCLTPVEVHRKTEI